VLTADVKPILPKAAVRPELLPIYDVSARHEVTNLAIAELILQRLGKHPEEWIEHVADRPNHDRRYLIEPTKLERELGWLPTVDFAAGLAETVDWYVANEAWWQDILRSKGRAADRLVGSSVTSRPGPARSPSHAGVAAGDRA
jgi:dTDP-glucose 4,6-dehydratase